MALVGLRGQRHAPAAFYPREIPIPIVQEAGWVPEPVGTGAEYLALTRIRSPGHPALNQSLYRLRYRANKINGECKLFENQLICRLLNY